MLGVIAGIGNGFIRVLKVKNNLVGDCIPVDYPINLLIAVAWFIATRR
jgi:fatty acyl-CoA reductase